MKLVLLEYALKGSGCSWWLQFKAFLPQKVEETVTVKLVALDYILQPACIAGASFCEYLTLTNIFCDTYNCFLFQLRINYLLNVNLFLVQVSQISHQDLYKAQLFFIFCHKIIFASALLRSCGWTVSLLVKIKAHRLKFDIIFQVINSSLKKVQIIRVEARSACRNPQVIHGKIRGSWYCDYWIFVVLYLIFHPSA